MDSAERQVTDTGTAGVIARPPLLFLAALLLGFVLDRLLSERRFGDAYREYKARVRRRL
jgi:protein-S-isoprenylcysteine O-methyltransferase Ste14